MWSNCHGVCFMEMKKLSRQEIFVTLFIFTALIAISYPNFILSLRRSRDQIRRDDLGSVQKMLDSYYAKYKKFPASDNEGRIVACNGNGCIWGQDSFYNIGRLPGDPSTKNGVKYVYISDTDRFQLFVSQEGSDEPEYSVQIESRKISCGVRFCNSGRSYNCPIDKSIEECAIIR